jgi:sensor c-di-GMP phosphodiesterase-like protein
MKSALIKTAVIGLFAAASVPAFATCTGADCNSTSNVEVKFDSSYYLSPNAKGIILQSNTGNRIADIDLLHVVMKPNGDASAAATAVGNNININVETAQQVSLRHVNQTNTGDQLATVNLQQANNSVAGAVDLSAQVIGNNLGISTTGSSVSLSELSVAQCNVGSGRADVTFGNDPAKLTAVATAVGNNISINLNK